MRAYLIGAGLLLAVSPAAAQDNSNIEGEVVVTAQRASADYLSDEQTVVGLRRTADSAIQPVGGLDGAGLAQAVALGLECRQRGLQAVGQVGRTAARLGQVPFARGDQIIEGLGQRAKLVELG